MTTIQTLEFLKYFTLKAKPVGFPNKSGQFLDYVTKEENITTPEGYQFTIRQLRVNWGEVLSNMKSDNFCDQYFCFDLRSDKDIVGINPDNEMRSIGGGKPFYSGGEQYVRYLFYSNHYYKERKRDPNWHMQMVNRYDNILYINEYGESYYPFSLIISIKAARKDDFDDFLKLNLTGWKNSFQDAIAEATKENALERNFSNFLKYPTDILTDALLYTDRIKLIEILAYTEMWDWLVGTDEVDEQEFTLQLIETIPENESYDLYKKMFADEAKLFRALDGRFDDDGLYQLSVFLMRQFYKNLTPQQIDTIKTDARANTDENKIIPIMTIVIGMHDYGATPIVEYEDTRVKIKFVLLETMDGDGHRWVYTYDDASNPYKYLQGKTYNYNEIVYAFCMFSKLDVGVLAGQIIPLPAFALKGINNTLSKKYSVKDLLLDIGFTVGFIMPYFGLAEELSFVINKWRVANNGVALLISFSDSLLGDYLKKYLERTNEGRSFLKIYNYITFAYGLKDSKEVLPLLKNLKNTRKLAATDYEFLLSAWGTYEKTNEYKELKNQNEEEYNKITNELNQIKQYYDEFIK